MGDRSEHRHPKGYRLNVIQIPRLRGFGSLILCIYVLFYDVFFSPPFSLTEYLTFVLILAAYCLGSWLILRYGYLKTRLDLAVVFLGTDVFLWLLAVYRTGADTSLLFFLSIVRVSDQAYTSFKKVLMFAHLTVLAYGGLLAYLVFVEDRTIDFRSQFLKVIYLY